MRKNIIAWTASILVAYLVCGFALATMCVLDVRALKKGGACLFSEPSEKRVAGTFTTWHGYGYTISDVRPMGTSEKTITLQLGWSKYFLIPICLSKY